MFYTPEDNGKGYYTAEYSVTGYFACGVGEEGSHFNFGVLDDESFLSLLRGQVNDSLFKMMESSLQEKRNRNKLTPYQRFASIYLNRFNMEYTGPVKPNEQLK